MSRFRCWEHPFCEFGGGGTTTTTQKSDPWSGQQPYLTSGFSQASQLYGPGGAGGPQYYPGQTIADPTQAQTSGLQQLSAIGQNGTGVGNTAQSTATGLLDPSFRNSNPGNSIFGLASQGGLNNTAGTDTLGQFASGAMANANNPYFQSMAGQTAASVLPYINSQFASGNRMDSGLGSRAEGLGLGSALGGLAYNNYQQGLQQQQSAAGQLANIGQGNIQNQLTGAAGLSGNYNAATQNQLSALGQAPNLNNMQLGNAQAGVQAGQQQQQLEQNQINDQIQRYNYGQQLPYSNLNNYMNLIQGNYGGTTTSQQPYFNNTLGQVGSAIGGIASIAPLFSDARLKTDIKLVGKTKTGIPIYQYRFYGLPETHTGVIAQEVMRFKPSAVHMTPYGYLAVDYREVMVA